MVNNRKCYYPECPVTKYLYPHSRILKFKNIYLCDKHFPSELFKKKKLDNEAYKVIEIILKNNNIILPVANKTLKKKYASRRCILTNCDSNSFSVPKRIHFSFPKTPSNLHSAWVDICNLSLKQQGYVDKYICDKHFNPTDITNNKLKKNSLPNRNLIYPALLNDTNIKPETIYEYPPNSPQSTIENTYIRTYSNNNRNNEDILTLEQVAILNSPPRVRPLSRSNVTIEAYCTYCLKSTRNMNFYQRKCSKLEKSLRIAKQQKIILERRYRSLQLKLQRNLKRKESTDYILTSIDNIEHANNNSKTFSKLLLQKRSKNTKYPDDQKNLAMNINYKSQATYNFLRDRLHLNLPSCSTIYRWTPIKHLTVGFNDNILQSLQKKISTLSESERYVTLLLDGMTIRSCLSYNEFQDKVIGYEDLGKGSLPKIAKEITTFMVRSDFSEWKSVVSWFSSKNAINGENLKNLIIQNITVLNSIGLTVTCVVADQGSNNRSAFNQLKITIDKPFISFKGRNIYFMYDPCHLIKSARNALYKHDLETPDGIASWRVLEEVHNLDRLNTTKLCPRLTDKHIHPNTFEKMNVRLAVQVLSHSCSSAIITVSNLCRFSETVKIYATSTAKFCDRFDKLFDSFNSRARFNFLKVYNCAIEENNDVYKYLLEMKSYLSQIKSPTKVYCIDGMIQTINALIMFSNDVFKSNLGISYVLTNKKNTDPLENFHGLVRGKNGFNRNPSIQEFLDLNGRLLSMKLLSYTTNITNCESDDEEFLHHAVTQIIQDQENNCDENLQNYLDYMPVYSNQYGDSNGSNANKIPIESTNELEDPSFSLQDSSIRFFTGYVVFKLFKRVKCSICSQNMEKTPNDSYTESELHLFNKTISGEWNNTNLRWPSDKFFEICKLHVSIFSNFINTNNNSTVNNIRSTLINLCVDATNNSKFNNWFRETEGSDCKSHHKLALEFLLLVLLRKNCSWKVGKAEISSDGSRLRPARIPKNSSRLKILQP